MSEKKRLYWVDFAKGIGIILVVVGHVWRGLPSAGVAISPRAYSFVEQWIYSFHMPLFFFIAGMFAISGMRKPGKEYLADKLAVIGWPYLLWSLIHGGMEMGAKAVSHSADSELNWKGLIASILWRPQHSQFWFLYVLLMSLLAFWLLWKCGLRTRGIAMAALLLFAVKRTVGFGVEFGPLYQFADEFVFVALGALLSDWLKKELDTAPQWLLPVTAAVAIAIITIAAAAQWPLATSIGFIAFALVGIAMVFSLSAMTGAWGVKFIAELGELSMPIYVAHSVVTGMVRIVLSRGGITNLTAHLLLGTVIGIAVPVLLFAITKRFDIPYIFRWGPSRILPVPRTGSTFVGLADAHGAA